jgi:hypothetical protein
MRDASESLPNPGFVEPALLPPPQPGVFAQPAPYAFVPTALRGLAIAAIAIHGLGPNDDKRSPLSSGETEIIMFIFPLRRVIGA